MFSKNEIFAKEPVNRHRQPELDMAKAVLVFFLAFIHCTIECTAEENLVSGIPYLFDTIIGGPLAAPMFMFAMGVGMVYTKRSSPKEIALRGLKIELLGFVLNICRYLIPYLIGYAITSDKEKYIEPLLYRSLCNDILQFAGIAMLLIALFKWLGIPDVLMLAVSFIMSLAGTVLNGADVDNPLGNIFLGYLVGTEDAADMVFSDFPLLNWFIVPVAGYVFGNMLIRVKNKNKFYLLLSPAALLLAIIYFIVGILNERGMFGEGQNCYYHITTDDVIASLLAAIGILGVYYVLAKPLPKKIMKVVQMISRNITYVYCIHWVIVTCVVCIGIYAVRGTQELPLYATMLLSLAISTAAIGISYIWTDKLSKARKRSR